MIGIFHCPARTFDRFDWRFNAEDRGPCTAILSSLPRLNTEDIEEALRALQGVVLFASFKRKTRKCGRGLSDVFGVLPAQGGLEVQIARLDSNVSAFADLLTRGFYLEIGLLVVNDQGRISRVIDKLGYRICGDMNELALTGVDGTSCEVRAFGYIIENEQTHLALILRSVDCLTAAGDEILKRSSPEMFHAWLSGKQF